ncbi:hypothetical protein JRQ81_005446 [Phrynocephalus forsythii]|uniref:Coiled-coil domain-containing protein 25 n=1 Tax=Phrynocephalus forsythii TaxID=171643 RepID=A0A9Q1B6P3_9SAUR|nr:hypothetical protein JRQ81_005446 [Phrynocephalus forsythii]
MRLFGTFAAAPGEGNPPPPPPPLPPAPAFPSFRQRLQAVSSSLEGAGGNEGDTVQGKYLALEQARRSLLLLQEPPPPPPPPHLTPPSARTVSHQPPVRGGKRRERSRGAALGAARQDEQQEQVRAQRGVAEPGLLRRALSLPIPSDGAGPRSLRETGDGNGMESRTKPQPPAVEEAEAAAARGKRAQWPRLAGKRARVGGGQAQAAGRFVVVAAAAAWTDKKGVRKQNGGADQGDPRCRKRLAGWLLERVPGCLADGLPPGADAKETCRGPVVAMVFYFTSSAASPPYTIYMGKDKYENEDLIKYGWPEDLWFHVDKLSSAHVYLRLHKGQTVDEVPKEVLVDCAQLVKANSIQGCKMNNVNVVYTPWANLKKTADMDVGQIGFHRQKDVKVLTVEKKVNEILNRLEKTKVERFPDLAAERESRDREERNEKKAQVQEIKRKEKEEMKKKKEMDELSKADELAWFCEQQHVRVPETPVCFPSHAAGLPDDLKQNIYQKGVTPP